MEDQAMWAEAQFAADPDAPRQARTWLAEQVAPLDLGGARTEDALLLVSELVTNVIVHTDSPPTVTIAVGPDRIEVGVADADGKRAEVRDQQPDGVGGWGLRIVDEIAASWGARYPGGDTKVLWFTIERPVASPVVDAPENAYDLSIVTDPGAGGPLLRVSGEVDAASSPALLAAIDGLVGQGADVVLDLAQVSFIDSSGIRTIAETVRRADAEGFALRIAEASEVVARLLEMTGMGALIER